MSQANVSSTVPPVAEPIVKIDKLTFRYGADTLPVFDEFSWQVDRGDAWAIIGPSGCGKSTLLKLIAGLQQPTSGTVRVDNAAVPRPRATTGLILQNHGLLPWATVWENATLGLRIGRFYRKKEGDPGQPRPYPVDRPVAEVEPWLERLGIAHLREMYPTQISGGQQQRVAIARTLSLQPNLLLMDEPFSALDALTREDLQNRVADLHAELGVTIIVVTHNVEEAAFLGRRILVLGDPPNLAPVVVENPRAGQSGYRGDADFLAITQTLRRHLGRGAVRP